MSLFFPSFYILFFLLAKLRGSIAAAESVICATWGEAGPRVGELKPRQQGQEGRGWDGLGWDG